jgi:hypothetical protein
LRLLRIIVVLVAAAVPLVGAGSAWAAELAIVPEPGAVGTESEVTAEPGATLESSTPSVCVLSGSSSPAKLKYEEAKTCTVVAKQSGKADQTKSFTVEKGAQTIVFSSAPPAPKVGGTYKASAEVTKPSPSHPAETLEVVEAGSTCELVAGEVAFRHVGKCVLLAKQPANANYKAAQEKQEITVGKGSQTINFTSTPPSNATVGGTYTLSATAAAGSPAFTIDESSNLVCQLSGTEVKFIGGGTCIVDANQGGSPDYNAAEQVQQSFNVAKRSQAITFTTEPPKAVVVGGGTYTIGARSESGTAVGFAVDGASTGVCSISGTTVSFTGAGTCTIDASAPATAEFAEAHAQQSITVVRPTPASTNFTPTPKKTASPLPATFSFGASTINAKTGGITFFISFNQPGAFSWLFTFPNGKFGVYTARKGKFKCASGSLRLNGKCRPATIVFGAGHTTIPGVGRLKVWFRPSASGLKALRNALKKGRAVPVSATFTFVPSSGAAPVTQTRSYSVKLKKH